MSSLATINMILYTQNILRVELLVETVPGQTSGRENTLGLVWCVHTRDDRARPRDEIGKPGPDPISVEPRLDQCELAGRGR